MSLSDLSIRSIKPPSEGQKLYSDSTLSGFALRVSAGGSKSFIVQIGKERRKVTIGRYPIISLSQARAEARRLLAEHTLGKVRPQSITYLKAVELFIEEKRKANRRPSTLDGYKRLLNNLNFKCQLTDISHADAGRKIAKIKAPSERSHTIVAGNVFFNWCRKRRYIIDNPILGIEKPARAPRERVLTNDELKAIWLATEPPMAFRASC